MRVLVDYRPALRARTGAGTYVHELVRAYTARHADAVTIFSSSWKDRVATTAATELRARVVDRRVPVSVLHYLWHRREWPAIETLTGPADVVHSAHPLIIPTRTAARVVTIHDLYFLSHRDDTHGEIRRDYAALVRAHAQRADAVVTSSHHTKAAIVTTLGVDPSRIHVVRPGAPAAPDFERAATAPRGGHILFVGTVERRKNLAVVLDAYERLASAGRDAAPWVIAGGRGPGGDDVLARLASPGLAARVTYRGYVTDTERAQLYRTARAVVLPSWDEGFGLPALEAMAAGVPVVVSDRGSLPEVVGAAGIVLPPDDPAAWADALERLTHDDALVARHVAAGMEQARTFSWTQAADALRVAYLDAIARRQAA